MAGREQRVNQIFNQGKQLGRSLLLLVHYTTVVVAFAGRSVQWMVGAVKWTTLFARCTVSVFDSIYRHMPGGRRNGGGGGGGAKEVCRSSDAPDTKTHSDDGKECNRK